MELNCPKCGREFRNTTLLTRHVNDCLDRDYQLLTSQFNFKNRFSYEYTLADSEAFGVIDFCRIHPDSESKY